MRELLIPYSLASDDAPVFPDQAFSGGNYRCPECKNAVGLRTPINKRAHFFHLPPYGTCNLDTTGVRGEGELHAFAKHCLYAWLERWLSGQTNSQPLIEGTCSRHGQRFSVTIPRPTPYRLLLEYQTQEGRRLDLALLNLDNRITMGFEVRASHRVSAEKAASLPARWLEMDAASITKAYSKLLSGEDPPAISLLRWAEYDQPSCCKAQAPYSPAKPFIRTTNLGATWQGTSTNTRPIYRQEPEILPPVQQNAGDIELLAEAGRHAGSTQTTPQAFAGTYAARTGQDPRYILSRLVAFGVARSGWKWSY